MILGLTHQFKNFEHRQVRYAVNFTVVTSPNKAGLDIEEIDDIAYDQARDIAVIKLNAPVEINNFVNPVCWDLTENTLPANASCFITGWGNTKGTGHSLSLKQLNVKLENINECSRVSSVDLSGKSQVCIKSGQKGVGPCSGDSGGPLVCRIDSNRWQLVGVTSRSPRGSLVEPMCGTDDGMAIYSSIPFNRDWIQSAMDSM